MTFDDTSLDQLGAHADAHYVAGKKANDKASQHLQSCGLYLVEAKRRVALRKDMTWPQYLRDHCPTIKSRSRADEVIAIVEGRTTVEETRERKATSVRKSRERSPLRSGGSARITQQNQESDPRQAAIQRINAKLERLTFEQLASIERIIPDAPH